MTSATLNAALDDYYFKKLTRKAKGTRRVAEVVLERFREYCVRELGPNAKIGDIDDITMARYYNRLAIDVQASTFNNYRSIMITFFNYCVGEGWTTMRQNPMRHIDPARAVRKQRLMLSAEELKALLDDASPRDRAALAIGMNRALRAQDIAALKVGSVNFTNNTLQAFIQKTQTEEITKMSADLRKEMLLWMQSYSEMLGIPFAELSNNYTLIPPLKSVSAAGGGLISELPRVVIPMPFGTFRNIQVIVTRALKNHGYPMVDSKGRPSREGFHTLRRSSGRIIHDVAAERGDGAAIRRAQTFLGHAHQSTTEIYLGLTHDKKALDEMIDGVSFLDEAQANDQKRNRGIDDEGDGMVALSA